MSDARAKLKSVLDGLIEADGVEWAGLVSRDGICVMESYRRELPKETFSAMSATLTGAAEIALTEVGGGRLTRVVAEADRMNLVVMGATSELLLVVLASRDGGLDALVAKVNEAVRLVPAAVPGD